MRHKKIIKRSDGSQVKIDVRFWADSSRDEFNYRINVSTCAPKKRTWKYLGFDDNYEYRQLDLQERIKFVESKQLEIVSSKEVLQAKLELWEKIKPV